MCKRYSDFMCDITSDELYDRLIMYGLFADKLPPVFDGTSFLAFCRDPSRKPFEGTRYSYASYDSMRNNNIPRQLGIPTPMGYERLCACLKKYWGQLQCFFNDATANQDHIVSRIHIRKTKNTDSLFQMNYENWREDGTPEPDMLIGKQYSVLADISKCFPSIYTHAISWALVGKDVAKSSLNDNKQWYNEIDKSARNMQNGETHGLLIGPHTSNILSEMILCKVDEELCKRWKYVRHIDDFCCFVDKREDADQFLIDLNASLKKYGLFLNHKKTKIKSLPIAMTDQWVRKIQNQIILFGKFHKYVDFREVQSFIDFCIDLMTKNEDNASILRYGMKVLKDQYLTQNAKIYCTKTAVSMALIYPYIVPLLDECVFDPFCVPLQTLNNYLDLIYDHYFQINYLEACAFALQYASKYDLEIHSFHVDDIIEKRDCILDLMALIYCRKQERNGDLKKLKIHAKELKENHEFDEFWPFAYECLTVGLLYGDWRKLKQAHVSFLKPEYQ